MNKKFEEKFEEQRSKMEEQRSMMEELRELLLKITSKSSE